MKEVKIEWVKSTKHISQVHNSGLQFAFVSKDWKQINQLVYCKDFLQDAISAVHNKKKISIYNFTYDPETDIPIYFNNTRLLITNRSDHQLANKIPNSIDFLNQIETKLKMLKTTCYKVSNVTTTYSKCGAFIYNGSKRWMFSPPMISLYSLLIRVSMLHTKGEDCQTTIDKLLTYKLDEYQEGDLSQISKAKIGLERVLKFGDRKLFSYNFKANYNSDNIGFMHNNCGIVGYSNDNLKHQFPQWYKLV